MRHIAVILGLVLATAVGSAAGLANSAQAASAVATARVQADFNNDGADDLAVGAPTESVGSINRAGAVNVLYGSVGGLTGSGSQIFTQDTPGVASSAEADDEFGFALVSGDFNSDGFADLAVGAPGEDVGTIAQGGAVNVLYGSASGLTTAGGQIFTQVGSAAEAGDRFGAAVAAGDFNSDSFADLAAGAPLEDAFGTVDAGAVSILPGSASGLTTAGGRIFTQVGSAAERGDRFGAAVAAGDFNGDSFADLAAGAPLEDVAATADAGAVSEVRGSADGLTATGGRIHTERSFTGPQGGDQFGFALASGEVTSDGFADLAVGVPFEEFGGGIDAGGVNVFSGRPDGLFASFEDFHNQLGSRPEGGDRFGTAVAAGDFNADGSDDLAVGVPFEDVFSTVDAGAVDVLYAVVGLSGETFTQDTPGVGSSAEPGDRFGAALAVDEPAP